MSKDYYEIKFVTLGQLSSEISVIVQVLPLDFSTFYFHLFIKVLSNVMNIRIDLFSYLPIR